MQPAAVSEASDHHGMRAHRRYINIHCCTCIRTVPPRATGRAASKPDRARPGRLRWRAAGPTAAHTLFNVVTDAVFHAPMFASNAFAL
jgi:hypothetical protein